MPITVILPDNRSIDFPDGTTRGEVEAAVRRLTSADATPAAPKPSIAEQLGRQLGLTARAGMTGLGNTVGVLSDPIASTINLVGKTNIPTAGQTMAGLADKLGLPKPATPTERIAQDTVSLLAGTGSMASAANMAARATAPTVAAAGRFLGGNLPAQLGAATGAGLLGAEARENKADELTQFGASLMGGLIGAPVGAGIARGAQALTSRATPRPAPIDIEVRLERAMAENGVDYQSLPAAVRQSILRDAEQISASGGALNQDALARLASYRAVRGTEPTAGTLTGNPILLTQEKNTAKVAANMSDPALQRLPMREFTNNRALVTNLDEITRQRPSNPMDRAVPMIDSLTRQYQRGRDQLTELYSAAREQTGRSADMDRVFFTNRASDLLDYNMLGGALPSDVRNRLNAIAQGEHPFNVNYAEQFKTIIGDLQRGSNEQSVRRALGFVRQALEETPISSQAGEEAVAAFNRARMLNRTIEGAIERNPALGFVRDALRDGRNPDPDQFVKRFLLSDSAKAADVTTMARSFSADPAATEAARGAVIDHLRQAARINADSSGNFSAKGFNDELFKLQGKMRAFFNAEEIEQLRAIGRVARYEQEQPRGSAVNNSNSGAMLIGLLAKLANNPVVGATPLGAQFLQTPLNNVSVRLGNRAAFDVDSALRMPSDQAPVMARYGAGIPALTAGMVGLLTAPMVDERPNR